MLHEAFGASKNIVTVGKEVVAIDPFQDEFWTMHQDDNFGEVSKAVSDEAKVLKDRTRMAGAAASDAGVLKVGGTMDINALKSMLDNFPEQKKVCADIAKHVNLVHALSARVSIQHSMDVSMQEEIIISCEVSDGCRWLNDYAYLHAYIHIYLHTCIHTYIPTFTHTYKDTCLTDADQHCKCQQ